MTFKFARLVSLTIVSAIALGGIAVPSASAKEICSVPKSEWRPQGALTQKLESAGWKIRNLKIDSGCYEVYGTDGNGKSRESHFNPRTLEPAAEFHKSN